MNTQNKTIAIIGLVQGAGVSQGTPNPDGRYPDVSRDFLGQGAANMATSLVGGLPADVQAKLLPNDQYGAAQPIKNAEAWEATSKKLPQMWQEQVIIEME